ncbi:DNA topoisomerase 3-beta [Dirofilaria immitis]
MKYDSLKNVLFLCSISRSVSNVDGKKLDIVVIHKLDKYRISTVPDNFTTNPEIVSEYCRSQDSIPRLIPQSMKYNHEILVFTINGILW